jgi:hypothetical protein
MESSGMNYPLQHGSRRPGTGHSPVPRFIGHFISVVFHPLFIPAYIAAFLLFADPYAFAGYPARLKVFRLLSVVFATTFLPAFSIFLLKQLGFIKSVLLRTQRDRIIPYIICMIYYFWAWYVSRNLHESTELVAMLLATFIASIAGLMANIYFKISMHGLAAGVMVTFFIWLAFSDIAATGGYMPAAVFIAGLVCTARFLVSDHNAWEVYAGLLAGVLCQLAAIGIAG